MEANKMQENELVDNKAEKKANQYDVRQSLSDYHLPPLIEELLDAGILVVLSKEGFLVDGFYSLNQGTNKEGFALLQEAVDEKNVFIVADNRNVKHKITCFNDLVAFNKFVWGVFYKHDKEKHRLPDAAWQAYMLQMGLVRLLP